MATAVLIPPAWRQLREFLERRRWQEVLVAEEVASGLA